MEIQWLAFETRMRQMVLELVAPTAQKVQDDSVAMLAVQKTEETTQDRLGALELVVFRDTTASTMVDDLRLRIEEGEAALRREIAGVRDGAANGFSAVREQVFQVDSRITVNEVMRAQFETFLENQARYEQHWLHYKDEVMLILAQTKEQFNEQFKELGQQVAALQQQVTS